ncbi:transmembrane protein, putative [Bodo saltans]|uniref:Transmembrane protein, putative n=1 Tax=Bodo saltans TaxID=75058 RepID=A0A0S4JL28_BODSA|nr:transmembrane protein, putative [Bodo saltans]|eukprot:CUG89734.1 transmembrane protein, putative [Bodo saltans]
MTSRPHTPRRFGTSHTPQAVDLLDGRRSAAADENIAGLYPEYWKNSGQAFRLRPRSNLCATQARSMQSLFDSTYKVYFLFLLFMFVVCCVMSSVV